MLVTAIPFSPVMAEDAGTTSVEQPLYLLEDKALYSALNTQSSSELPKSLACTENTIYTRFTAKKAGTTQYMTLKSPSLGNKQPTDTNIRSYGVTSNNNTQYYVDFAAYNYYVIGYRSAQTKTGGTPVLDFCFFGSNVQRWPASGHPKITQKDKWITAVVSKADLTCVKDESSSSYKPAPSAGETGQYFTLKPWQSNDAATVGETFDVSFVAFFDDEAAATAFANAYNEDGDFASDYTSGSYNVFATVSYDSNAGPILMNGGKTLDVLLTEENASLQISVKKAGVRSLSLEGAVYTYVSSAPEIASVDDNGVVTPHSKGVAEITVTVTPVDGSETTFNFKLNVINDNSTAPVIFNASKLNFGVTNSLYTNQSAEATENEPAYKGWIANADGTSNDGLRYGLKGFDGDYSIYNHRYMAIRYKTNIGTFDESRTVVACNPVANNSYASTERLWGSTNYNDIVSDKEWNTAYIDLQNINGGDRYVAGYSGTMAKKSVLANSLNSFVIRMTPHDSSNISKKIYSGEYLNIAFVGFFTDTAQITDGWWSRTVTYKNNLDDTTEVKTYGYGSKITLNAESKPGYSFIGWYNEADEKITEIASLESDMTVTAKYEKPIVLYDQHALTAAANGFTNFSTGKTATTTMVSLSGTYANTFESAYDEDTDVLKFTEKSGYDSSQTQKVRFGNDDNINNNGIVFNVDVPGRAPYVKLGMTANADNYGDNILLRVSKEDTGYGPWWSWRVDFAAEGGVFDATTGYRDKGVGDSWEGKTISDGGKITGVFARPFNNSAKTEQAEMNVRYIAFFETKEAADNYVYAASEEYTVTYLEENGKVLTTQYYSKVSNSLTLTDMLPTAPAGQAFDHWCFNDGSAVPDNYVVTKNITLYPSFTAPGAVFDAVSITASAAYSNFISVSKQIDGNGYVYNIAKAKNTNDLPTTGLDPYSKVEFTFNSADNKVNMIDYPIMAVCYRGDFYDGKGETNLTVDNKTLWEGSDVSCVSSADWNLKLFDKTNAKKFYSGGSGSIKYPYTGILSKWVPTKLMMRISSSQTNYTDDNYFDLLYIAFFKTEAQAKSYTYAPTYSTVTVTYSTDEAKSVTISDGAKLSETIDDDAKTTTATYIVRNGESVTFTAVPNDDYNMDGWYNVTNGHNVLLGDGADTIDLEVTSGTELNVRFLENAVEKLGRLVVIPDRGVDGNAIGTISVDGVESDSWIDTYVSTRNSTRLTASVKDDYSNDYVFAFWWRLSSKTESFLGATDEIDVYPLGNQVYYQPVFAKKGATVKLYVDFANTVIGVIGAEVDNPDTEEPSVPKRAGYNVDNWVMDGTLSSDNVEVYKPSYTNIYENENSLTIVDSASNETTLTEENGLVYNAQVNLTPGQNHRRWYIIIENNGTFDENGKAVKTAFTLSHKDKYSYYHVLEGAVVISDVCKPEGEGAEYANSNYVHTLQVQQRDDNRIHFAASLNVNSGYELVERGVLMTNNAALADSGSFMINTPGVIEGRINETEVTDIYLVAKSKVKAGDTWYGRAYMIVKDRATGELETVYADEILSKTYTESTTVTD